jgi:hypothetical protein
VDRVGKGQAHCCVVHRRASREAHSILWRAGSGGCASDVPLAGGTSINKIRHSGSS